MGPHTQQSTSKPTYVASLVRVYPSPPLVAAAFPLHPPAGGNQFRGSRLPPDMLPAPPSLDGIFSNCLAASRGGPDPIGGAAPAARRSPLTTTPAAQAGNLPLSRLNRIHGSVCTHRYFDLRGPLAAGCVDRERHRPWLVACRCCGDSSPASSALPARPPGSAPRVSVCWPELPPSPSAPGAAAPAVAAAALAAAEPRPAPAAAPPLPAPALGDAVPAVPTVPPEDRPAPEATRGREALVAEGSTRRGSWPALLRQSCGSSACCWPCRRGCWGKGRAAAVESEASWGLL